MQNKKVLLYSIYLTLFIDALGIGIIFPIMPSLFFSDKVGFFIPGSMDPVFMYSLVLATFPLFQMFGAPCLSVLSDRYGRKNIMQIGLFVVFLSYILSIIAILQHNFFLFLLYRGLSGFFGGITSVANALISDLNDKSRKKFASFRLASIAEKSGLLLGPALSIFITKTPEFSSELSIPFAITALLVLFNILLISFGFNRLKNTSVKSIGKIKWNALINTAYEVIQFKKNRWLMLSFFSFQFGAALFFQSIPLYLTIHMQYKPHQLGFFSLMMSISVVISMIVLGKLLGKHHATSKKKIKLIFILLVFIFSLATIVFLVTDVYLFEKITLIWMISVIFYFLNPLIKLLFVTLFSKNVEQDKQGWIMGAIGQIIAVSYFMSSFLVAPIILNHLVAPTSTILFIVAFACLFRFFILKKKNKGNYHKNHS